MTLPPRVAAAALFVSVALLACSDDDPSVRSLREPPETSAAPLTVAPPTDVPSAIAEGSCANEAQVATNPLNRAAGPLIGDVTGDGAPDRVYVSLDTDGPSGCQAFVVVSATTAITAPIAGWDPAAGVSSPSFNGLAQIDGRPGAEIVVNLAAGASTQFVGAFSLGSGAVERITTSGADDTSGSNNDLFAYGGSVGHLEAVDCTSDGKVVLSSAIPKGARYQVSRSFFVPSGPTLEIQASDSRRSVVTLNELEDFPEFAASPFGNCPAS